MLSEQSKTSSVEFASVKPAWRERIAALTQIRDIQITRRSRDMGPEGSDRNVLCLDHGTDCVPMSSSKLNECDFMHYHM